MYLETVAVLSDACHFGSVLDIDAGFHRARQDAVMKFARMDTVNIRTYLAAVVQVAADFAVLIGLLHHVGARVEMFV